MTTYIGHDEKNIFYGEEKKITIVEVKSGQRTLLEHNEKITFMSEDYFTDEKKELYKIIDGKIHFVTKLQRNIFKLVKHDNLVYVADRFGNVYKISENTCIYVLGTACYITGMDIYNKKIFVSDKYGRIRVSNIDGTIEKYIFESDPIFDLITIEKGFITASKKGIKLYDYEKLEECHAYAFDKELIVKKAVKKNGGFVLICEGIYLDFDFSDKFILNSSVAEDINECIHFESKPYKISSKNEIQLFL